MAVTPEGKVKSQIDAMLKKHGAYYLKPVQNGLGAPALDYHGIHRGRGFVIEAKRLGGEPTPRQWRTIYNVQAAGGEAFIIDGDCGLAALASWLKAGDPSANQQVDDRSGDAGDDA